MREAKLSVALIALAALSTGGYVVSEALQPPTPPPVTVAPTPDAAQEQPVTDLVEVLWKADSLRRIPYFSETLTPR